MAQALVAIKSARVFLNDINGISWTDSLLMPMLQEAHGELLQELELNSIGVLKFQTAPILIPAGSTDMGGNLPAGIISPISVMERTPGDDSSSFVDMIRTTYVPETDPDAWLLYWTWIGEQIKFVGATENREVILRFDGVIQTPQLLTDPLGVIFAERYLGARIAAIAYESVGKDGKRFQVAAERALYKIIQTNVLNDQRPVRRRGYRSPKASIGVPDRFTVLVGQMSSGGSKVQWILTSTPPDGVRTSFAFSVLPKWISYNGINQFQGEGYTLSIGGGTYNIVLQDVDGNVITPAIGDDIRAEIG